jgi:hypothetical protein
MQASLLSPAHQIKSNTKIDQSARNKEQRPDGQTVEFLFEATILLAQCSLTGILPGSDHI